MVFDAERKRGVGTERLKSNNGESRFPRPFSPLPHMRRSGETSRRADLQNRCRAPYVRVQIPSSALNLLGLDHTGQRKSSITFLRGALGPSRPIPVRAFAVRAVLRLALTFWWPFVLATLAFPVPNYLLYLSHMEDII